MKRHLNEDFGQGSLGHHFQLNMDLKLWTSNYRLHLKPGNSKARQAPKRAAEGADNVFKLRLTKHASLVDRRPHWRNAPSGTQWPAQIDVYSAVPVAALIEGLPPERRSLFFCSKRFFVCCRRQA